MKFTLVCDESYTENKQLVLGTVIIPSHNHPLLIDELTAWKESEGLNPFSEFKWTKVSKKYFEKYKALTEWFFDHLKANHLSFRAHVIDTGKDSYKKYGNGDIETSFYKVYYHLLFNSIKRLAINEDGSRVIVYTDNKHNRYPLRLTVLKKTLNSAIKRDLKIENIVTSIEPRESKGRKIEPMIQIVDILIGAIGFVRNGSLTSPNASEAKINLVKFIEEQSNTKLLFDTNINSSFNLWTFDVDKSMLAKKKRKELK